MRGKDTNYAVGISYENFVENVYNALIEADKRKGQIGNIVIERRKKIISKSGTSAEIDIYWEYDIAGIKNSVAIECKNYNKNVDIPAIRDFARKISNISGLKGLMVTMKGFSQNAIQEARSDNIDLIIIREHAEKDFDGYMINADIHIYIMPVAKIIKVNAFINKEMAVRNNANQEDKYVVDNDKTIIEDSATGFKYSFLELEKNAFFENKGYGKHIWRKDFKDGRIHYGDKSFEIQGLEVEYITSSPIYHEIHIDFEQYVLAVMEYVSGGEGKYVILKTGERKALEAFPL